MKKTSILKTLLIGSLFLNLIMGAYVCKRAYFIWYGKDLQFVDEECDEHCKYFKKALTFEMEKNEPGEIIFLGNSLTEWNDWSVMFNNPKIKNRGIAGDNTIGVLKRLDEVLESFPEKIFLEIGINDILMISGGGYPFPDQYMNENILVNYEKIIVEVKSKSPQTRLYIQSLLPVMEEDWGEENKCNFRVKNLNQALKALTQKYQLTYIDLYQAFEENGQLKKELTYDGLHLTEKGYLVWKNQVEKYVKE